MIISQSGGCTGKLEAVCYNAVESHSNLNLYPKKLLFPFCFHRHIQKKRKRERQRDRGENTQHNFTVFNVS